MKKMPCLFQRDFSDRRHPRILDAVTAGCEWVLQGEGVATRKRDGTACLVRDGELFKRYDAKRGKQPPPGFVAADDPDPVTGHWPGWLQVKVANPDSEDVWHALAWAQNAPCVDGTYELVGPKINGNAEKCSIYKFYRHGGHVIADAPREFAALRTWLSSVDMEGVVFWRDLNDENCDKCKIRRADFDLPWG